MRFLVASVTCFLLFVASVYGGSIIHSSQRNLIEDNALSQHQNDTDNIPVASCVLLTELHNGDLNNNTNELCPSQYTIKEITEYFSARPKTGLNILISTRYLNSVSLYSRSHPLKANVVQSYQNGPFQLMKKFMLFQSQLAKLQDLFLQSFNNVKWFSHYSDHLIQSVELYIQLLRHFNQSPEYELQLKNAVQKLHEAVLSRRPIEYVNLWQYTKSLYKYIKFHPSVKTSFDALQSVLDETNLVLVPLEVTSLESFVSVLNGTIEDIPWLLFCLDLIDHENMDTNATLLQKELLKSDYNIFLVLQQNGIIIPHNIENVNTDKIGKLPPQPSNSSRIHRLIASPAVRKRFIQKPYVPLHPRQFYNIFASHSNSTSFSLVYLFWIVLGSVFMI